MALLESPPSAAQIERLIRSWRANNPAFLWCPTKPSNFLLDQQRRVQGRPSGRVDVGYGGVKVAVPNGDSYLSFPATFGLGNNGNFLAMVLVDIKDPASVTGAFLKIGSGSDGVSIGGGLTTHEDSGSKLILLRETFAWDRSPANAFVPGMNVLSFYFTTNGVLGGLNHTTGGGVDVTPGGTVYLAPTVSTSINGAGGTRGSNATVCAVAIWPEAYDNTATVAKRAMLSAGLDRLSGRRSQPLFTPELVRVPVSAAGGGLSLTPSQGALALTGYAPTLARTANQAVTPSVKALALSTYAPAVAQSSGLTLTPIAAALTISSFAPSIAQPKTVTPSVKALALSTYVPTVQQTSASALIPAAAALGLTTYAPTVARTANQSVSPAPKALTLASFAPGVVQASPQILVPGLRAIVIGGPAPTVTQAGALDAGTPGYIASAPGRSWRAAGASRSFVAEWGDR